MKLSEDFMQELLTLNVFNNYKQKMERQYQLDIINVLKKIGATSKETAFIFDDNYPWFASSLFCEDLADTMIEKVWLEKNMIRVSIRAYYIGEIIEDINYAECEIDNSEFLEVLLNEINYRQNKNKNIPENKGAKRFFNYLCVKLRKIVLKISIFFKLCQIILVTD